MKISHLLAGLATAASMGLTANASCADDAPAAAAAPVPLSTPAMTPPLSANANPTSFDTPLGKIFVSGQLTGLGFGQNHAVAGDRTSQADLSNAQIEIQKTDGVVQFYVQAGAYSLPSLGATYVKAEDLPDLSYHYVPVAFLKLQPNANFSLMIGELPTLIGAEYTFTFENMNVARGLLWNQEPAISRGVQANYTQGPLTVAVALNDGFFSNRFTTGSTLITFVVKKTDTVAFDASAQFDQTSKSSFATPLAQNDGQIYNLMWTHSEGAWLVEPYLQYSQVPRSTSVGIPSSGSTFGAAVLAKYSFTPMFSLAGRVEYETSSGHTSLLYGPRSKAMSLTLTPTWQFKTFFIRGEVSYTKLDKAAAGAGFGASGLQDSQTRAMIETGFLF